MRIYLFEWFKDKKDGKMKFCIVGVRFKSECVFRISLEVKPVLMNRGTGDGPSMVVR